MIITVELKPELSDKAKNVGVIDRRFTFNARPVRSFDLKRWKDTSHFLLESRSLGGGFVSS